VGYCLEGKAPLRLWRFAQDKQSRLILALDLLDDSSLRAEPREILGKCFSLLERLKEYVVGVKIGFPLSLNLGVDSLKELIQNFKEEFYFLSDFKLGDIPEVNKFTLRLLERLGFDGATIHLFQGSLTNMIGDSINLFGILMMSHPEAIIFEKNFEDLLKEASNSKLDGVIVGATKKQYIQEVRSRLPRKTILCPGVVIQGAEVAQALRYGGDFEIIGRAITASPDPALSAKKIVEVERNVLQR